MIFISLDAGCRRRFPSVVPHSYKEFLAPINQISLKWVLQSHCSSCIGSTLLMDIIWLRSELWQANKYLVQQWLLVILRQGYICTCLKFFKKNWSEDIEKREMTFSGHSLWLLKPGKEVSQTNPSTNQIHFNFWTHILKHYQNRTCNSRFIKSRNERLAAK